MCVWCNNVIFCICWKICGIDVEWEFFFVNDNDGIRVVVDICYICCIGNIYVGLFCDKFVVNIGCYNVGICFCNW